MNKVDLSEFDKNQLEQLSLGIDSGVDILLYLDTKYNFVQMEQIRLGLEKGILPPLVKVKNYLEEYNKCNEDAKIEEPTIVHISSYQK